MFGFNLNRVGKRAQNFLIATEDGRIWETTLPVEKGFAADDDQKEAWLVIRNAQIRKAGTNSMYLLVCERSMAPFDLENENFLCGYRNSKDIARESLKQEKAGLVDRMRKDKFGDVLKVGVLMLFCTVALMALVTLFSSGKLHLPNFGGMF